jgi:DNA segregation ATPase FtsK/SpoIIIE, S-DNA-T family
MIVSGRRCGGLNPDRDGYAHIEPPLSSDRDKTLGVPRVTRTETVAADVGCGDDTFGWDLMTSNSHKKRARELQARTGMPYTRALREVTKMADDAPVKQNRPTDSLPAPSLADPSDGSDLQPLQPVPFGVTRDGSTLALDLNDAHFGGNGPHALLIGMTGAGKSTLLYTLAYGLCAQQPAGSMRLVFIHGHRHLPAVMADFANYPQMTAISGPDTALEVLHGITAANPPPPHTVVIVDDYDALLHEQPDTSAQLESLMRTGRGRAIHVVLACQQLTAAPPRLADNATARIALRTATEQCSWDVIGTSEAAHLPPTPPGLGFYVDALGASPVSFQSLRTPRSLVASTADRIADDQPTD